MALGLPITSHGLRVPGVAEQSPLRPDEVSLHGAEQAARARYLWTAVLRRALLDLAGEDIAVGARGHQPAFQNIVAAANVFFRPGNPNLMEVCGLADLDPSRVLRAAGKVRQKGRAAAYLRQKGQTTTEIARALNISRKWVAEELKVAARRAIIEPALAQKSAGIVEREKRHRRVIALAKSGVIPAQICEQTGLARGTVNQILRNAVKRGDLDREARARLVRIAFRHGQSKRPKRSGPPQVRDLDRLQRVANLHREGMTKTGIAERFGISRPRVAAILVQAEELGVDTAPAKPTRKAPSQREIAAQRRRSTIIAMAQRGRLPAEIACEVGMTKGQVNKIIRKAASAGQIDEELVSTLQRRQRAHGQIGRVHQEHVLARAQRKIAAGYACQGFEGRCG